MNVDLRRECQPRIVLCVDAGRISHDVKLWIGRDFMHHVIQKGLKMGYVTLPLILPVATSRAAKRLRVLCGVCWCFDRLGSRVRSGF